MTALLAALVVLVGELVAAVAVARVIGVVATLLLLLLFSAGGAWLVKREGLEAYRRIAEGMRGGRIPASGLVDGFLVMAAGALLFVPGFVTDLVGLLLLVRPVRARVGGSVMASIERRVSRRIRVVGTRLGAASPFGDGGYEPPFATAREARFTETAADEHVGGQRRAVDPDEATVDRPGARDPSEVIDLEAEEYYLGDPVGELGPPPREH